MNPDLKVGSERHAGVFLIAKGSVESSQLWLA